MEGVDFVDKIIEPYYVPRKPIKWYKKLGIHMMQIVTFNAHALYKKSGENKPYAAFMKEGISTWLFPDVLERRHFLVRVARNENGQNMKKRCRVCRRKHNERKQVIFYCAQCPL